MHTRRVAALKGNTKSTSNRIAKAPTKQITYTKKKSSALIQNLRVHQENVRAILNTLPQLQVFHVKSTPAPVSRSVAIKLKDYKPTIRQLKSHCSAFVGIPMNVLLSRRHASTTSERSSSKKALVPKMKNIHSENVHVPIERKTVVSVKKQEKSPPPPPFTIKELPIEVQELNYLLNELMSNNKPKTIHKLLKNMIARNEEIHYSTCKMLLDYYAQKDVKLNSKIMMALFTALEREDDMERMLHFHQKLRDYATPALYLLIFKALAKRSMNDDIIEVYQDMKVNPTPEIQEVVFSSLHTDSYWRSAGPYLLLEYELYGEHKELY